MKTGIRKATAWYNSHLTINRPPIRGQPAPTIPTVVLITEDAANRQKAEKAGISSISGKFCFDFLLSEVDFIHLESA
jgi:exosome complex exonuclease DIS3/RRP44